MVQNDRLTEMAQRRNRAVKLRRSGMSWVEIAETMGYDSGATAYNDVKRAREQAEAELRESVAELKQTELDRLDAMTAEAWRIMEARHLAVSGGKVIMVGPEGDETELTDDGPALDAIRTLLRIAERRSKLLGLDAPVRVEAEGELRVVVEGVAVEGLK